MLTKCVVCGNWDLFDDDDPNMVCDECMEEQLKKEANMFNVELTIRIPAKEYKELIDEIESDVEEELKEQEPNATTIIETVLDKIIEKAGINIAEKG